ncbi:MAG: hypothetical protein M3340_00385 [Actinomycetota bacterium]|nr:hypothetical protein [Actinomycetota bacterium]
MSEPAWSPLANAGEVERYLGDHAALLDLPGTRAKGVVESTVPLRVRNDRGRPSPVDLALRSDDGALEPKNPLVPTRLPANVRDPIVLGDRTLTITTADAARGSAARTSGDAVFYASYRTDSDFIAKPVPGGVETLVQLRSSASPERYTLDLDLPSRARLVASRGGGLSIKRGQKVIGGVLPAHAVDAQGWPVSVSMRARKDRIVVDIEHRGRDLAYPLLLDPTIWLGVDPMYDQDPFLNPSVPAGWQWEPWTDGTVYPGYTQSGSSYYLQVFGGAGWYYGYEGGGWVYRPQGWGETFIYKAKVSHIYHFPKDNYMAAGLRKPDASWDTVMVNWPGLYDHTQWLCVQSGCPVGGTPGNHLFVGGASSINGWNGNGWYVAFGGAQIWMADRTHPVNDYLRVVDVGTGTEVPYAGAIDGLSPVNVTMRATDGGLGVKQLVLDLPWGERRIREHSCVGSRSNPCPNVLQSNDGSITAGSESFQFSPPADEGAFVLNSKAIDLSGRQSPDKPYKLIVDRSDPKLNLGGSLYTNRQADPSAGPLTLTIDATDGSWASQSSQRSGVVKVQVFVDGSATPYREWTQACPDGSCPMSQSWTLNPGDLSPGAHKFRVRAVDRMGRATSEEWWAGDAVYPEVDVAIDEPAEDGTREVRVTAMDGDRIGGEEFKGSGVSYLRVESAGRVVDSPREQTCDQGGCEMSKTFLLGPGESPDGVVAFARDQSGNNAQATDNRRPANADIADIADAFLVDRDRWFCPPGVDPGIVTCPARPSNQFAYDLVRHIQLHPEDKPEYLRATKARNNCDSTGCPTGIPPKPPTPCPPAGTAVYTNEQAYCALADLKGMGVKLGVVVGADEDDKGDDQRPVREIAKHACAIRQADQDHLIDFMFLDLAYKLKERLEKTVYRIVRGQVHDPEKGWVSCSAGGWPKLITNDTTWAPDAPTNLKTDAWAHARHLDLLEGADWFDRAAKVARESGDGVTGNDFAFIRAAKKTGAKAILRFEVTNQSSRFGNPNRLTLSDRCVLLRKWARPQLQSPDFRFIHPLYVHGAAKDDDPNTEDSWHTYDSIEKGTFALSMHLIDFYSPDDGSTDVDPGCMAP